MTNEINLHQDELRSLTQEMLYTTVGDVPYAVVTWDSDEQGRYTFEKFLCAQAALTPLTPEEFANLFNHLQSTEIQQAMQALLDLASQQLSSLTLYAFSVPDTTPIYGDMPPVDQEELGPPGIPVLIGFDGCHHIGLIPQQSYAKPQAIDADELVEQFHTISQDMLYDLGSSWRVKPEWVIVRTHTRDELILKLLTQAGYLTYESWDKFWRITERLAALDEGEERDDYLDMDMALRTHCQSQLVDARIHTLQYVIGGEWYAVHYVLGYTNIRNVVGVMTSSFTF